MNERLPHGWTWALLGNVALSIRNGISAKPSGDSGQPILRISAVRPYSLDLTDVRYLSDSEAAYSEYVLEPRDLLFTRYNGSRALVGVCAMVPAGINRLVYPDKLIRVRLNGEVVDPRFVQYAVHVGASRAHLEARARTTAGQTGISGADLRALPLPVPPLTEQCRIVAALEEHLSDLDAAVTGLERARANVQRFRTAVQDEAVLSGASRWRWASLGEYLSGIEAGASFKCEERPPVDDETGVVKVSAVTWGTYNEDESKTALSEDRVDERLLIRPGDFLFSRANTIKLVGACVIAERVTRRVMLSDKILRLHFRDLDPRWALLVLRSAHGRGEIERLATGNQESMRNIGQERIRSIRIPVPSPEEQHGLVTEAERRLSIADRTAAEIDVQLARAKRLRQSILKRAFEGRLVPQDPNDEPASVLLDRIRAERAATPAPCRARRRTASRR